MRSRLLVIVLVVLLIANVYSAVIVPAAVDGDLRDLNSRIAVLEEENADLLARVSEYASQAVAPAAEPTPYLPPAAESLTGAATLQAPVVVEKVESVRNYPLVRQRVTEKGSLVDVSVEVVPGRGRVLVQTTPLMGVVFQDAGNTAVSVACEEAGVNLSGSDVIFSVMAESEVSAIDGPSAGALMTALLLSVLEKRPVNDSVTLTGTIDPFGNVGEISGVAEKAQAAHDAGKDLILLPRKNNRVVSYGDVTRSIGGVEFTLQHPEDIDARQYIENEIGIRVEYVDSIRDVMRYIA
ncbi:hypothetical protein ABH15_03985 [Methanoculleus taiwanensis]|uniref:Lon proteolytic domain-containing protein n=1 Tax=Methanoculleus taiwanensis TaxID=1550565 RepID=A0A498H2H4_9EURY|nr:S16 family serine protease [Methanoculleus taiwanensis]RXE57271.1 hypothetical protein ABH15_03985 [Methanoculleus taiwanensis]